MFRLIFNIFVTQSAASNVSSAPAINFVPYYPFLQNKSSVGLEPISSIINEMDLPSENLSHEPDESEEDSLPLDIYVSNTEKKYHAMIDAFEKNDLESLEKVIRASNPSLAHQAMLISIQNNHLEAAKLLLKINKFTETSRIIFIEKVLVNKRLELLDQFLKKDNIFSLLQDHHFERILSLDWHRYKWILSKIEKIPETAFDNLIRHALRTKQINWLKEIIKAQPPQFRKGQASFLNLCFQVDDINALDLILKSFSDITQKGIKEVIEWQIDKRTSGNHTMLMIKKLLSLYRWTDHDLVSIINHCFLNKKLNVVEHILLHYRQVLRGYPYHRILQQAKENKFEQIAELIIKLQQDQPHSGLTVYGLHQDKAPEIHEEAPIVNQSKKAPVGP